MTTTPAPAKNNMAATCDCLATAWRSEVSPTRGPSRECQLGRAKTPLRPGTRRSYTDGRWSRPGMPPAGRSLAWPAGRGCRPGVGREKDLVEQIETVLLERVS